MDFSAIPPRTAVAGNVGAYAGPIAEHVMAMTLSLCQAPAGRARGHGPGPVPARRDPSRTLHGAVCGILGFGGIGQATARLMRPVRRAVHALNSSGQTTEPVDWIGADADLDQLLAASDVLVISIPLTAATRGLIGKRELALMKPDAILVNVARGAIESTSRRSMPTCPPTRASARAIDAWWDEPRTAAQFHTDYPFFELPNLLGSPHNSGDVPGCEQSPRAGPREHLRLFLDGEPVQRAWPGGRTTPAPAERPGPSAAAVGPGPLAPAVGSGPSRPLCTRRSPGPPDRW